MKLYITYEDKGPSGIVGQEVTATSAWQRLYILEGTYQEIKNKLEEMENSFYSYRRSPRFITTYWEETGDNEYDVGNDVYHVQTGDLKNEI